MNQMRVFLGAIAAVGFGAVAACSSSSSGDGSDGGGGGGSSGGSSSSSGSSSGTTITNPFGGDGGPTTCPAGQMLCIGALNNTCADVDGGCGFGTTTVVYANDCAANADCQGGKVCCSSFADSTGNVVLYDGDGGLASTPTGVTVQCLATCPTNAASSEVCDLDDAGNSSTTCPTGTSCRDYTIAFLAPRGIPNTLCLPPIPDAGFTRPMRDGGTTQTDDDGGTPASDAASE